MPDQGEPLDPLEVEAEVVNLGGATLDEVEAEVVHIHQGGANQINASTVEMQQGGALMIQADTIDIYKGVAGLCNAEVTELESSSAAAMITDELVARDSRLGLAVANRAKLDHSSPLVLLARDVEGSVEPVLDTRGALLAGLASGIVIGTMLVIGNLFRRR
jgi:hypothetical protein